jgi:hypothetical protein
VSAPVADGAPEERRRRISFALVGQAAAVVGLIGGVVGLVFTFVPSLRPGSGSGAAPTAKLEISDVNERATVREYAEAEGMQLGSLSPAALRVLGVLTTVHYTTTGFEGKELQLVVSLASGETGATVCRKVHKLAVGGGITPTFRAFTPFPSKPAAPDELFNVHVTLFRPDGKPPPLDARDHNGIPGPGRVQATRAAAPLQLCDP